VSALLTSTLLSSHMVVCGRQRELLWRLLAERPVMLWSG
jgi:hypothetical protein